MACYGIPFRTFPHWFEKLNFVLISFRGNVFMLSLYVYLSYVSSVVKVKHAKSNKPVESIFQKKGVCSILRNLCFYSWSYSSVVSAASVAFKCKALPSSLVSSSNLCWVNPSMSLKKWPTSIFSLPPWIGRKSSG